MRVYHNSDAPHRILKPQTEHSHGSTLGVGVYVTQNKEFASNYGRMQHLMYLPDYGTWLNKVERHLDYFRLKTLIKMQESILNMYGTHDIFKFCNDMMKKYDEPTLINDLVEHGLDVGVLIEWATKFSILGVKSTEINEFAVWRNIEVIKIKDIIDI